MNTFIWTDLSTYYPRASLAFYQEVFRWEITPFEGYFLAHQGYNEIAGVYETPAFFQEINMPHFWMNYIKVEDLHLVTSKAGNLGGKVELDNEPFYGGRISLIRDPMGAGFTIYEGNNLNQSRKSDHGCVIGRELHTSDVNKVQNFYASLFNWKFKEGVLNGIYDVFYEDQFVCSVSELSNDLKGKFEYWTTIFKVDDLPVTLAIIEEKGGVVISNEGQRFMCCDPYKEAFFYIQ